ncbi:MAG: hypothetical protein Q7V53_05915 [Caldisericota bacterium]|nr:hypothetical protein [Caldisericota bacterium]
MSTKPLLSKRFLVAYGAVFGFTMASSALLVTLTLIPIPESIPYQVMDAFRLCALLLILLLPGASALAFGVRSRPFYHRCLTGMFVAWVAAGGLLLVLPLLSVLFMQDALDSGPTWSPILYSLPVLACALSVVSLRWRSIAGPVRSNLVGVSVVLGAVGLAVLLGVEFSAIEGSVFPIMWGPMLAAPAMASAVAASWPVASDLSGADHATAATG